MQCTQQPKEEERGGGGGHMGTNKEDRTAEAKRTETRPDPVRGFLFFLISLGNKGTKVTFL